MKKKEMKKWLTKNWLAVIVILLLGAILVTDQVKFTRYKREVRVRSDSIVVLKREYQGLEKREALAAELIEAYIYANSVYRDSLSVSQATYIKQKQRHVKEINALLSIPTDSLYRDVAGWLDTVSFQ